MQLAYLYINKFQVWENQGFQLSSRFQVEYHPLIGAGIAAYKVMDALLSNGLQIHVCGEQEAELYGTSICDIRLIVGRNGAGKSTVLHVLADDYRDGREWFAFYITERPDSKGYYYVLLEGYDEAGPFLEAYRAEEKDEYLCGFETIFIHELPEGADCNFLIYRQNNNADWYQETLLHPAIDRKHLQRITMHTGSARQIFEYAWKAICADDFFEQKNTMYYVPENVFVTIQLKIHESKKKFLERGGYEEQADRSIKERFFGHLYRNIIQSWMNVDADHSEIPVFVRRSYLRKAENELQSGTDLVRLADLLTGFFSASNLQEQLTHLEILQNTGETLPESLFLDERNMEIRVTDCDEQLKSFLSRFISSIEFFQEAQVSISNLSNGEIRFLDLFASIESSMEAIGVKPGTNCILLLDEPDYGFHPEWSRNLIYYLKQILNQETFARYQCSFQLLITTHSPILLSDVPKQHILCIEKEDEGQGRKRNIVDSDYGFMSNISDLMKQTFFMDSLYGENARQYTNQLIQQIIKLQAEASRAGEQDEKLLRIKKLETEADLIGESVIRDQMKYRLQMIRRQIQEADESRKE